MCPAALTRETHPIETGGPSLETIERLLRAFAEKRLGVEAAEDDIAVRFHMARCHLCGGLELELGVKGTEGDTAGHFHGKLWKLARNAARRTLCSA